MENVLGTHALMLTVREVICEQVYRNRGKLVEPDGTFAHPNHINRTLGIRDIPLDHVFTAAFALPVDKLVTEMTKDELKVYGARVLDEALRLAEKTSRRLDDQDDGA